PAARLQLAAANPCEPPYELAARIVPEDYKGRDRSDYGAPVTFDRDGTARVTSSVIGRARVVFVLIEQLGNTRHAADFDSTSAPVIEVRDQTDEQTISVAVDPRD